MNAAVIINPNAGALRKQPKLVSHMRKALRGHAQLLVTRDERHLGDVCAALAEQECTDLGIVGGDGTASTTLTEVARAFRPDRLPAIALLRGGTMNTVANALGIRQTSPLTLVEEAQRCWQGLSSRQTRARPCLRVGDRLGFLFGTGVMYGYLAAYYDAGDGHPTPWTAATVFGSAVSSALIRGSTYKRILNATPLSVRFDGGAWESRPYMTVCAGTVDQAGLGFRVFERAYEADDRFQLIAIKGSPADVARDLPRVWLGKGLRSQTAYGTLTQRAELSSDGAPFGYFVDGDLYRSEAPLPLSLGPAFDFLLPADHRI